MKKFVNFPQKCQYLYVIVLFCADVFRILTPKLDFTSFCKTVNMLIL